MAVAAGEVAAATAQAHAAVPGSEEHKTAEVVSSCATGVSAYSAPLRLWRNSFSAVDRLCCFAGSLSVGICCTS